MKLMPGLTIESGIDKSLVYDPIWVTKTGLQDDEHDLTFHGGLTKAVHACKKFRLDTYFYDTQNHCFPHTMTHSHIYVTYSNSFRIDCSTHYPSWQSDYPSAVSRFVPGGFGENLVFKYFNERNICIGDVFSIGDGPAPLLLQVSQPRQPCFKLNHRFQLKNFAPETTRLSRTGWYFRVLQEGWVKVGDDARLKERVHSEWTLERLQSVLYRGKGTALEMKELIEIKELTDEIKGVLKKRLSKLEAKQSKRELVWTDWRLTKKYKQTPRISSFVFEALDENTTTTPESGSHVKIRLTNGLVRAYSIVHGSRGRFELGIARDENSRGGSKHLHDNVHVGDILQVGAITPGIKPNSMASNHLFIVAGIGITAFLWLMEAMVDINWNVQLHYAVRDRTEIPFGSQLEKLGKRVSIYNKTEGQRMDIARVIKTMPWNTQVYVCGPRRLMDDALNATREAGLQEKDVHFEAFNADIGGDPFEVVVKNRNDKALVVKGEETLLEVLQKEFGDVVGSSCEVGNCGTCKVTVKCGQVEHRGTALTLEEKEGALLSCVSRGIGKIEIEIGN